jgi:copper chaperone CopZ
MQRFAVVLLIILVAFGFTSAQTAKTKTMTLAVSGMKCDNCVTKVDKALRDVEGVKDVNVSLKNNSAKVVFASTTVKPEMLLSAISDAGFGASAGKLKVAAKKDGKESCSKDKDGKMKMEGASKDGACCSKDGKKDEAAKEQGDCCKDPKKTEKTEKKD